MAIDEVSAPARRDFEAARLVSVAKHPIKLRDFYIAAGKALRDELARRDAVIVYARIEHFGAINNDPLALLGGRRLGELTDASRVILVIDHSNEGLAFSARFAQAMTRLRDQTPDKALVLVHVQNNARLPAAVAALENFPPCLFGTFHHHMWTTLSVALADGGAAQGRKLVARQPAKAILCLNRSPRLPRMLALLWLYRTFPHDDFIATFGGFENSKHDFVRKFRVIKDDFPSVKEFGTLVDEVDALAVPGLVGAQEAGAIVHRPDLDSHAQTFFSFVTESDMSAGEIERFTEKSIKPLMLGHPMVIAGNPSTVRALERLGFDLLRDGIDHFYDEIAAPEARLEAAFRAAERLARLPPPERAAFLRRNRERLAANVDQFDGRLIRRIETAAREEATTLVRRALDQFDAHPRR